MSTVFSLLLAMRPKTLAAGLVPVSAGSMILWHYERLGLLGELSFSLPLALYTLASCLCIQIACNLFNDAIDAKNKADTAHRQGPKRMTASGQMSGRVVTLCALFFLLLAAGLSLPLLEARGWGILAIGLPSMLLAWGYTGSPIKLAYRGLGEVFVILFFGLIAVVGTIYVQIGWPEELVTSRRIYAAGFIVGIQIGLLSSLLLEINNIRDRKEDATTGKRTLAVRLGDARARGLALAFIIAPYITIKQAAHFLPHLSWHPIWWAPMLLAGYLFMRIRRCPADKRMNPLLGLASAHLILFVLALSWY